MTVFKILKYIGKKARDVIRRKKDRVKKLENEMARTGKGFSTIEDHEAFRKMRLKAKVETPKKDKRKSDRRSTEVVSKQQSRVNYFTERLQLAQAKQKTQKGGERAATTRIVNTLKKTLKREIAYLKTGRLSPDSR